MTISTMKAIRFSLLLGFLLSFANFAEAQKVYRIGSLNTAEQFVNAFEGFKIRMAELGYVEGRNVRYDVYDAKGSDKALSGFARKMVQDRVDLIVTSTTSATVVAVKAVEGTNLPVVFLSAGNPQRLIKNFASSGGNLAGISAATLEITGKKLELLRELAPRAKRIASLNNAAGANFQINLTEVREGAKKLGFDIWEIKIHSREEIVKVAPSITRKRADAILIPPDSLITSAVGIVIAQSLKEKLPLITSLLVNVKEGCLATYAADYFALGRQGAVLADKILKGAKPSELPIELPEKLNLALNLKTAKAIGLKIPRELLLRADEVIE